VELGLKWQMLNFFGKFDRGVDFFISGLESDSKNLNTFVMSFMTCVQNLRSIKRNLLGSDVVCRNWKFQSSLGLNLCEIRIFSVVGCDLKTRLSSYDVVGLFAIFGCGPGGPRVSFGCLTDQIRT